MDLDRRMFLELPLLGGLSTLVGPPLEVAARAHRPQPGRSGLLRFGVMGDGGSGAQAQADIAAQMQAWRKQAPWEFALSLGDNVYENGETEHFDSRFLGVYRDLLSDGVPIHSTLGNHDVRNRDGREMVATEGFGFIGKRDEYEMEAGPLLPDGKRLARFVCLNSNAWIDAVDQGDTGRLERLHGDLRERLGRADKYRWNIAFFHHPIHSYVKKFFFGVDK
ncbi:MAG: metallophosphoesterase [Bryobacterales bacterium]